MQNHLNTVDRKQRRINDARPLPPVTLQSLKDDFTIRYAHETTAIEGNTLDIYETRVVLEDGVTIGGKTLREHLEVLNIRDALAWLEAVAQSSTPVNEDTIQQMHRIVMQGILKEEAGFYRRIPVYIQGAWHVPPNWNKLPQLMEQLAVWLGKGPDGEHPVVFAAKAHIELVRIHPFVDGNGRTARLLTSLLLMRSGYPPAMYASGDRNAYMKALDNAHMNGDLAAFIEITTKAVEFMQDRYLLMIEQVEEARQQTEEGKAGERHEKSHKQKDNGHDLDG